MPGTSKAAAKVASSDGALGALLNAGRAEREANLAEIARLEEELYGRRSLEKVLAARLDGRPRAQAGSPRRVNSAEREAILTAIYDLLSVDGPLNARIIAERLPGDMSATKVGDLCASCDWLVKRSGLWAIAKTAPKS